MPVRKLSVLLLLCLLTRLSAQQHAEFRFSKLDMTQGLSSNDALVSLTDSRGFTWIGTKDGLNCFDGESFRVFRHRRYDPSSIPHNTVFTICEEKNGLLLLGTPAGIAHFNPWSGKSTTLVFADAQRTTPCDHAMIDRNGNCWAWTVGELYRLNPISGKLELALDCGKGSAVDRVASFYQDKKGKYWLCSYNGLHEIDFSSGSGKVLHTFLPSASLNLVTSMYEDSQGATWCGSWGAGFLQFFPEQGTFAETVWDLSPSIPSASNIVINYCETFSTDGERLLWASTNHGLALLHPTKNGLRIEDVRFFEHDPSDPGSICEGQVATVSTNAQHQLWACTTGGISVLLPEIQVFQPFAREVKGSVIRLSQDRGNNRFVCTWYGDGLQLIDSTGKRLRAWKHVPENSTDPDDMQISDAMRASDGTIWVAAFGRLSHGDASGDHFESFDPDEKDPGAVATRHANSLAEDAQHNIWCGTYGKGVCIYHPQQKKFSTYNETNSALPNNLVWDMLRRKNGEIWIATNNGVAWTNGKTEQLSAMKTVVCDGDSIATGICFTIFEDGKERTWFGGSNGIFCRDVNGTFHWYGQENGLAGNDINGITEDRDGNLWIATGSGLSEITTTGLIRNFGLGSGLPTVDLSGDITSCNGQIILGLNSRFIAFNPGLLNGKATTVPVFITRIAVGAKDLPLGNDPAGRNDLVLDWEEDMVSFDFVSPGFRGGSPVSYEYRLSGADHNWVSSGVRHFASYGGLSPGAYTFEVRASVNNGSWSTPVKFSFVIRPPFWKTWWFIVLCTLLTLLTVVFVVRREATRKMRVQLLTLEKQQAIERERNRISRDMHDDLGSGLTKIAILSEVVKKKIGQPEEAQKQIDNISDSARNLVDNLNEIIWALNPDNDNLRNLAAYIREYADNYLEPFGLRLVCEISDELPAKIISEEKRRFLFLVVKETLHNIVKHAQASVVTLRLVTDDNGFSITVEDDGKGFEISEARPLGNGLKNMQKRMDAIGAKFNIVSSPGKGTTVTIDVR